jgi:acyl carrier protein
MDNPTFEQFANVMKRVFDRHDGTITRETRSIDVVGWDSLSHVMLILELQSEFEVNVDPQETVVLSDVGGLFDFIALRCKDKMP